MKRTAVIPREQVRLAARLLTPEGLGPFPCVIFVHGLGSDKDSPRNVVVAEALVDRGVAALLFDLSNHGESSSDPEGAAGMPADVTAAFTWVARQPEIDRTRIGISGSSLGGVVAVDAVASGRIAPAALVLRAPPVSPSELRGIRVPTLVVVGSLDPLLRGIRAAVEGMSVVHLEVVPGASHLFEEPGVLERAVALTVDWFVRHVAAREPSIAI